MKRRGAAYSQPIACEPVTETSRRIGCAQKNMLFAVNALPSLLTAVWSCLRAKAAVMLVLGGNQGNRVSIAAFPTSRVAAYVWPSVGGALLDPAPERYDLPLGGAALSRSEA